MNKVLDHLYIGGKHDLRKGIAPVDLLIRLYRTDADDPPLPKGVYALELPAPDGIGWTSREFIQITGIIQQHLDARHTVGVMCAAGKSRSAVVVLAYLCTYKDMTLQQAWTHLKQCRPVVDPNFELLVALVKYLDVHPYLSTLIGNVP